MVFIELLYPKFPIHRPVLDRFGKVLWSEILLAGQICDRSGMLDGGLVCCLCLTLLPPGLSERTFNLLPTRG